MKCEIITIHQRLSSTRNSGLIWTNQRRKISRWVLAYVVIATVFVMHAIQLISITFKMEELLIAFKGDLERSHLAKKKALLPEQCKGALVQANSLEFTSSDHFLCPNLQNWLGGRRSDSNIGIIEPSNVYLMDIDRSCYLESVEEVEKLWIKCMELKSDYVSK